MTHAYVVALTCALLTSANAANILGIFPLAARSHHSCNHAIMKSLHAAGHQITMINPYPSAKKVENFTDIDSGSDTTSHYLGHSALDVFTRLSVTETVELGLAIEIRLCNDVMNLKVIQEALSSTKKLYDVMVIELLTAYDCYLPIAEKLGIPVIGTITLASWKRAVDAIGVPNNPVVIPNEMAESKPDMNFFERVRNIWTGFLVDSSVRKASLAVQQFYREHFPEYLPGKKGVSLLFSNSHPSLIPRSTPPNAVEIAGIHLQPAKTLPEDVAKFIDEASNGAILFSFGSIINGSTLPPELIEVFLAAFASLPQRVVWKFEKPIENLPKNIMLLEWLPQRDILEHKNVLAFMSHCGLSSVYEAVATGTPVVTIPLFADQWSNAAYLQWRKVAVNLDWKTVTKESVIAALNTIINDTSNHQRMRELSRVFKDRPTTPQESIVYWTEYVIRHDGAPHLKALGTDMPLYEYLMLDIVASGFTILGIVITIVYLVVKKMCLPTRRGVKEPTQLKKRN